MNGYSPFSKGQILKCSLSFFIFILYTLRPTSSISSILPCICFNPAMNIHFLLSRLAIEEHLLKQSSALLKRGKRVDDCRLSASCGLTRAEGVFSSTLCGYHVYFSWMGYVYIQGGQCRRISRTPSRPAILDPRYSILRTFQFPKAKSRPI